MQITSIIIAGGRSSRMGMNKALLPLDGKPVIEQLIEELEPLSQSILIAGGELRDYEYLGRKVVADFYPGLGPLAGLHAGLSASTTAWNLVVACDMPFVRRAVFEAIVARATQIEKNALNQEDERTQAIIVKIDGRVQPLLAAYSRSVLPELSTSLVSGRLRMTEWAAGLRAEYIDGAALAQRLGVAKQVLQFNMNDRADYDQARFIAREMRQNDVQGE
ncbi:molybdenum cofactor guanylyltransferase [Paenibacillus aceti]|nr:molybdenum cofactor guanylyltransferase [Paenibacillus aceti]